MKHLLVLITTVLIYAQPQQKVSSVEILSVEKARYQAMIDNNQKFLNNILAKDLTFTHANGATESKIMFLERLSKKDLIYHSIVIESSKVQIYNNCAVVTGVSLIKAEGKGRKVELRLKFTTVYTQIDHQWKVVAYQSTISQNKPTAK